MNIMQINWKVRFKNKDFWAALIPAVLLFIQTAAAVFGYTLDFGNLGNRLLFLIESAFVILTILGVVNDPTTKGISDSEQALTYDKPKGE